MSQKHNADISPRTTVTPTPSTTPASVPTTSLPTPPNTPKQSPTTSAHNGAPSASPNAAATPTASTTVALNTLAVLRTPSASTPQPLRQQLHRRPALLLDRPQTLLARPCSAVSVAVAVLLRLEAVAARLVLLLLCSLVRLMVCLPLPPVSLAALLSFSKSEPLDTLSGLLFPPFSNILIFRPPHSHSLCNYQA